ncbi:MAG TPA: NAD(P)/FAD-dependent oxidoreductase [Verrucomicrobiae bacterium]|nr:NAD(P)/FAD-dependent oxidoreductase [Verrucomicrobiae bacterium]
MSSRKIIVVGGGAAGFFAAITCAEALPGAEVIILERGPEFLSKVRISGGGRCNVTHACFDPRDFTTRFPRGEQELIGPFQRFGAKETVDWFKRRGVKLNAECDGRMFPLSNTSQTIIDCLVGAAKTAGVKLRTKCGVESIVAYCRPLLRSGGPNQELADSQSRPTTNLDRRTGFDLTLSDDETLSCDRLLLATGGCRTAVAGDLAVSLGHTLEPPVPSLFTFHLETPWLHELAGVSVESVDASVPGTKLQKRGALLVTHTGLSGPVILRLSAWGARELHERDYKFPLRLSWLPKLGQEEIATELQWRRSQQPARLVVNTPIPPLPARLWEQLVIAAGVRRDTRWAAITRSAQHTLLQHLIGTEFQVTGKSLNKEEFVTCGGVRLSEVNFRTMQSRLCPGLYFAGELLDIDGVTGGFNFQSAWTTGWIAGGAMAA